MPVTPKRVGGVFSSAVMFLVVSVLSGLLIAGLAVPFAAMAGSASTMAADELENLPEDLETPPAPERSVVYLGNGEVLRYAPDEDDLLATERKVDALWQAIASAYERRDFRARRSALCGWCDHQALCPEFGGTPPPFPEDAAAEAAAAPSPPS